MPKDIKINTLSLADLRKDHEGILIKQVSRLIKDVFSEPPWNENFSIPRLQFGLGIEMMRKNPLLLVAQINNLGDSIVGYLLGQELFQHSSDPRNQTLYKIAGNKDLDYLFGDGKRVFYVSGIGVLPGYRPVVASLNSFPWRLLTSSADRDSTIESVAPIPQSMPCVIFI